MERDTFFVGESLDADILCGLGAGHAWDFSHVDEVIESAAAAVPGATTGAYVFGISEPQQLRDHDAPTADGICAVVAIPVLVVVTSEAPPPERVGVTSVQSATERIVPMASMKMGWVRRGSVSVLQCSQRRCARVKEERSKSYEYALPHFLRAAPDAPDAVTAVSTTYTSRAGETHAVEFDKDCDRTQIYIPEFIEDNGLDDGEADAVKQCLKDAFVAARAREQERADSLAQLYADDVAAAGSAAAIERTRLTKVYPRPVRASGEVDAPLLAQVAAYASPLVNRYYGRADKVEL